MAAKTLLLYPGVNKIVLPPSGPGRMAILAFLSHQLLQGLTLPADFNSSLGFGLKQLKFNDGKGPPIKEPRLPKKPSSPTQLQRLGGTGRTTHRTGTSRWSTGSPPKSDLLDLNFVVLKDNSWHQRRNFVGFKTTWPTFMQARTSRAFNSNLKLYRSTLWCHRPHSRTTRSLWTHQCSSAHCS